MIFIGKPEEGCRLAYIDIDVQIIFRLSWSTGRARVEWMHLVQDIEKWRAWVDVVVNVFV
jgi:hypothetical protein